MARSSCGVVYVTASPPSGKAVAVVAVVVHMHNESMVILFVFDFFSTRLYRLNGTINRAMFVRSTRASGQAKKGTKQQSRQMNKQTFTVCR